MEGVWFGLPNCAESISYSSMGVCIWTLIGPVIRVPSGTVFPNANTDPEAWLAESWSLAVCHSRNSGPQKAILFLLLMGPRWPVSVLDVYLVTLLAVVLSCFSVVVVWYSLLGG